MTLETMKTSRWWSCVSFVFFRLNKVFILTNQFNNMDLNIEENTLKHIESLIYGRVNYKFEIFQC